VEGAEVREAPNALRGCYLYPKMLLLIPEKELRFVRRPPAAEGLIY
jgi:hypothetical protein